MRGDDIRKNASATTAEGTPLARDRQSLRTVGLFSGIGGFELGLQRAGHEPKLTCEIDPIASHVLKTRLGHVVHEDVCSLRQLPKGTELVVGGFPCQDLSQAGRTVGIGGSRSGLVGEIFRLLASQRVPWLALENVPFMLQLAGGRALDVIVAALERLGYKWAYRVVDSRAFGLPQRRRRVFLVASLVEDPRTVLFADDAGEPDEQPFAGRPCGFYWTEGVRGLGWAVDAIPTLKGGSGVGVASPPAIWLPRSQEIVTPDICDAERLQGFAAHWTRPAEKMSQRNFRWKLVGNAISVPVARWLGERLAQPRPFSVKGVSKVVPRKAWPTNAWNVGNGRYTAEISEWPKRLNRIPLDEFLKFEPKLLSARATAGFVKRLDESYLRFPTAFRAALESHLKKMSSQAA